MKSIRSIILVCLLLTGCGTAHNAIFSSKSNNEPTNQLTVNTNNQTANTTSSSLPTPPVGFERYPVIVNHKAYQFLAKSEQDTHYDGLVADTKYGVAWANPTNPAQILLSPPGTKVLSPKNTKVIYTFTLPSSKDKAVYDCATGYFDVSPDAPDYLFWGGYVYKKADARVGTENIHALNLKTGKDRIIIKDVRTGGGYNWSICFHSHYVFYLKETPTISDYKDAVHVVDLNTGKDRLIWTGQDSKLPKFNVPLDNGTFTPVWKPYGTLFSFQ